MKRTINTYFINIFKVERDRGFDAVVNALENKVSSEMNEMLTAPYTTEEIILTIKQMHPS